MSSIVVCKICWKDVGKYTCPRCQLPYCSVKCYQDSEHQNCSEKFYEEEVVAELKDSNATDEEKKAMLEMIRQFEAGCMQDEEDLAQQDSTNQLAERLKSVDLDGDSQAIWSKLTAQERDEFMKLVKEERLSELIKQWIPWWSYKRDPKPLVSELKEEESEDLSECNFPEIITTIKTFQQISKSPPADSLKYNAINILVAYTFTVMRYNGEHLGADMCVQCAEDFVSLSDVLLLSGICKSTTEAIRTNLASLKTMEDMFVSIEHTADVLHNTTEIIEGPDPCVPSNDYLLMAFSDMLQLVSNSRKQLKKDKDAEEGRKKLLLLKRKLEYFFSWVVSYGCTELIPLIPEVLAEKETILAEEASHKQTAKLRKKTQKQEDEKKKIKIEVLG